jgi:hypothetical protein
MLSLFRRHMASCKHSSKGRSYRSCGCPISAEGTPLGEYVRRSRDLRNWEAACKLVREWRVNGPLAVVTVKEPTDRFVSARESMKLSDAMVLKYRLAAKELSDHFGDNSLRSVTTDRFTAALARVLETRTDHRAKAT